MLISILNLALFLLILGLVGYVLYWVLGLLGVAVPPRVLQIVGAIILVIVLIVFVQAVAGGGYWPRMI